MAAEVCTRGRVLMVLGMLAALVGAPQAVHAQVAAESDIALVAANASTIQGNWTLQTDPTAAGGARLWNRDAAVPKLLVPFAAPTTYFELSFTAEAGRGYRLWIRGRADLNAWTNDSVYVQFSGAVSATGVPVYQIGSASATVVSLEDCSGCGVQGWGWQDNGYGAGVLGPLVFFAQSGPQTLRVQQREDGISIDQVVLSPARYLTVAPGAPKNDATILVAASPVPAPVPVVPPVVVPLVVAPPVVAPVVPPTPGNPVRLRILQWNLHHGVGTDGRYDIDRIATAMAAMTPDIVMLNEVEKYTGWGNENQPERYRALLQAKTGRVWYSHFTQEYGNWTGNGKGSQILSTFPFDTTDQTLIVYGRVIGAAAVTVNGRVITLMETHLDPDSQPYRLAQAKQVITWALARPDIRIISGDFNAWPDQSSIAEMRKTYTDSWEAATALGKAFTFAGNNPIGATKNGRIDYIFYSKGVSNLGLIQSQVVDTRNAAGVMPSDHRPVVTTLEVR
jgi:endonuclease/exonuclease/phosphatase family metal-dependent hydrolase